MLYVKKKLYICTLKCIGYRIPKTTQHFSDDKEPTIYKLIALAIQSKRRKTHYGNRRYCKISQ